MHNRQEVLGFLGKDAQIFDAGEKRIRVVLSVASTHSFSTASGERSEHTEWFQVKMFANATAKAFFTDKLVKGALVYAAGRTVTEKYQTASGEERESRCVLVDSNDLRVIDREKKEPQHAPRSAPAQAPASTGYPQAQNGGYAPAPSGPSTSQGYSQQPPQAPPGLDREHLMDFGPRN
jgi:single stranded DNA-binding protein